VIDVIPQGKESTMSLDHAVSPWTIRSTLVVIADLERSVAFYGELGGFEEVAREDAVVVLGHGSPASIFLILRELRGVQHVRHGQQSLGVRSVTFNVASSSELDRIESVLRGRDLFTSRGYIVDPSAELLRGRDPDNMPLVFVCYAADATFGPDYFQAVATMAYALDA
jgi:hypothetical protein